MAEKLRVLWYVLVGGCGKAHTPAASIPFYRLQLIGLMGIITKMTASFRFIALLYNKHKYTLTHTQSHRIRLDFSKT
jgi:hypothetical protein